MIAEEAHIANENGVSVEPDAPPCGGIGIWRCQP